MDAPSAAERLLAALRYDRSARLPSLVAAICCNTRSDLLNFFFPRTFFRQIPVVGAYLVLRRRSCQSTSEAPGSCPTPETASARQQGRRADPALLRRRCARSPAPTKGLPTPHALPPPVHVCSRMSLTRPRHGADDGGVYSLLRAVPQGQPVRHNFFFFTDLFPWQVS